MLVYGECECFVMQMLYVCVLCASCGSSQCCVLHDLQFVNAGRGCNKEGNLFHHIIHKYTNNSTNAEETYLKVCVYMEKHVAIPYK